MKKWWELIWECAVVIVCCVTVILNAAMIATYWQLTNELDAVGSATERMERQMDEVEINIQLLEARVMALELGIWY